jgi:hypothetical protein
VAKAKSPFREPDIRKLLDHVGSSAKQVETNAENLRDDLIAKTFLGTEVIQERISTVGQRVRDLNDQCEEIDSRILGLTQRQNFIFQQVTDALSSQNGMLEMLKDVVLSKLARMCREDGAAHLCQNIYTGRRSGPQRITHGLHRIPDHLPNSSQVSSTNFMSRTCKQPTT